MEKSRRTLMEMALDAVTTEEEGGRIACRKCGCQDFMVYGTNTKTFRDRVRRYKQCRNCGQKYLVDLREWIVREVNE